jgi:hypothetical protein
VNLVFSAMVPGWTGAAPDFMPAHVRLALRLSFALAWVWAIGTHLRIFGLMKPEDRESVVAGMAHSSLAPVRALVQLWKLVALVTRC